MIVVAHLGAQELIRQRAAAQQAAHVCKAGAVFQQAQEGCIKLVRICRQKAGRKCQTAHCFHAAVPICTARLPECRPPLPAAQRPAPTQREVRALVIPHRVWPLLLNVYEAGHIVSDRRATHCSRRCREGGWLTGSVRRERCARKKCSSPGRRSELHHSCLIASHATAVCSLVG